MPPAPRKPKTRYHHGDLRPALIAAALRIIEKDGPAALTLRGVAQRVGVSAAAPYHHFPDKEAILAAVAEEGFAKLLGAMEEAQATAGKSAQARLQATGVGYVRFAARHPSHYRVMFAGEKDAERYPSLHLMAERTFTLLVENIRQAQAEGSIREGTPEELGCLAWSTVHGLAMLHIEGMLSAPGCPTMDIEPFAAAASAMIARGLAPG
jgi:AcrR family transcriptional regulator